MEPAGDQARELTATELAGPGRSFRRRRKATCSLAHQVIGRKHGFSGLLVLPRRTPVPDASHQRRPFASRIRGWDRALRSRRSVFPARRAPQDASDPDAANRLHELSPVRREVQRFARGTCSHRRGRADQGGRDRRSPAGPEGARTIDCGGRVVMPGLIDAHWHAFSPRCRSRLCFRRTSAISSSPPAPRRSAR